jgi:hypothetical protein
VESSSKSPAAAQAPVAAGVVADPLKSVPKFELVGMGVDYGNAFDREISSRLL